MILRISTILYYSILLIFLYLYSYANSISGEITDTTEPEPEIETYLESGTENEINSKLSGENVIVELYPGSVFLLSDHVQINTAGQQIYTQGNPTDDTRTVLRILSEILSTAVLMRDFDEVVLSHMIEDENRPGLGYRS